MTIPAHDLHPGPHGYEQAFEELWQQTCLGRFSVAEVKQRLHDLRERFGSAHREALGDDHLPTLN